MPYSSKIFCRMSQAPRICLTHQHRTPLFADGFASFCRTGPSRWIEYFSPMKISKKCLSQGHNNEMYDSRNEPTTFLLSAGVLPTELCRFTPFKMISLHKCSKTNYFKSVLIVTEMLLIWLKHSSVGRAQGGNRKVVGSMLKSVILTLGSLERSLTLISR